MTKRRDFKRLVRERMAKTGERYAAARAKILAKSGSPSGGSQSETGALTNTLRRAGWDGSEDLVFGLCGGIGFLYAVFEYKDHPPMLTIVGRHKSMPDAFVLSGFDRFGFEYSVSETSGAKKAAADLDAALEAGTFALCTVDGAALPYYGLPSEMLGMGPHVVSVLGRDGDNFLIDDRSAEPMRVSVDDFAAARAGYRRGKHRLTTFGNKRADYDLSAAVKQAISACARGYDEPPAKPFAQNVGTAGLEKWARLLADERDKKSWRNVFAEGANAYVGLRRVYDCIQHDYTAADASRPMYAAFLDQAAAITGIGALEKSAAAFRDIGKQWRELGAAIAECGDAAVAKGCGLSDERAERLDEGSVDIDAMKELWLKRRALAQKCRLDKDQCAALYDRLSAIVSGIAAAEKKAIAELGDAVR